MAAERPGAAALVRERADIRVTITPHAHETFGAAPGAHDNLVLAVALAVWGSAHGPAR